MDLDVAVHAEDEFVMRARVPGRLSLGANAFECIDLVLPEYDFLVGSRLTGNLEAIGESVVFDVVADRLDSPFLVVSQRSEVGPIGRAHRHLLRRTASLSAPG